MTHEAEVSAADIAKIREYYPELPPLRALEFVLQMAGLWRCPASFAVHHMLTDKRLEEAVASGARLFDLLEAIADKVEASGGRNRANDLRAGFARGTGGADIEWLAAQLTIEPEPASLTEQIERLER
jgi:hypothetical protein